LIAIENFPTLSIFHRLQNFEAALLYFYVRSPIFCGGNQALIFMSIYRLKLLCVAFFALACAAYLLTDYLHIQKAAAYSEGPPAAHTNAPGESNCTECHIGNLLSGGTRFTIMAPTTYQPGVTYQITVRHTSNDTTRKRWGFQLTALDGSNKKAGNFQNLSNATKILDNAGPGNARQYIEQTTENGVEGTFRGQTGGATWTFNWTAPATNVGPVTFYACGNQANNDGGDTGDQIYAAQTVVNPNANPIDDPQFFVAQQYHDFLNRDPDPAGLQFWTNEITSCGGDAACVDIKRQNVSAAYFLSVEFQQTGYEVYLFTKVSFNRRPLFSSFLADTQAIGQGVVVGQGNWQQQLEQNKQQFANDWINRTSFRNIYDVMTNAQYVDALIANAGVAFDQTTRDVLVNGLNAGTETRATVVRKIAENGDLAKAEFNRAFVLMQYFGYLRRNPDDPPDNNLNGYNFWLDKLNRFNGDYIASQMIRSFIVSTEYRKRFGAA
jgi:hypothetical protein